MFKLKVTDEIINYVEKLLEEYNFGRRGYADGNYDEQKTGMIGQTVMQMEFEKGKPDGKEGFDDGVDLEYKGKKIDIKTMGRKVDPKPHYVNNFIGLQERYDTDIMIFCSYNKANKYLTVCGWITKNEFLKKASFHEKGSKRYRDDGTSFTTKANLYELKNRKLNSPDSIDELKAEIKQKKLT